MIFKKLLCALLAAILLLSATGLSEALPAADVSAVSVEADGRKVFSWGDSYGAPVKSMDDAVKAAQGAIGLLKLEPGLRFEPWREMSDTAGNRYYVLIETRGDNIAYGGAVKVVADPEGRVLGIVACAAEEELLPEDVVEVGISAEEAERIALEHADGAALVPGRTRQIILPVNRDVDMEVEVDVEPSRTVWAVYTENPGSQEKPFTVRYVTLGGEYLYDMPVKAVDDEAALCGYDAPYYFDGMEPAPYTGKVKLSDGTEREISIDLMRDPATGTFYLANPERRVAVADCYEMLYNKGHVVLEQSADNTGWDDTCLLSLYNYCRAWDFYHDLGWTGADGLNTPLMILKDFCDKEHNPIDNAAYAGMYYGWQMFLSSNINNFSQCLDVLAHEFTHCFTHSAMTYNAYRNDFGAINEAMSDIMGNLCEQMAHDTEESWILGENSGTGMRSMDDPHRYQQPEYTWDIYYNDAVNEPTEINDRGGVHSNSSLLNNVAYRLCAEGGMDLEKARRFWFAVDLSMVPGTDYEQLRSLLPWVLENQGMQEYAPALEAALTATRLGESDPPETLGDNRALVTFELPEGEQYTDGTWQLVLPCVDVATIFGRLRSILERKGEYAGALEELEGILAQLAPDQVDENGVFKPNVDKLIDRVMDLFASKSKNDGAATSEDLQLLRKLQDWARNCLSDVFYLGTGSAGMDDRTVRMMAQPGLCLPILVEMDFEPNSVLLKSVGAAVYFSGNWIDLSESIRFFAEFAATLEPADTESEQEEDPSSKPSFLDTLLGDSIYEEELYYLEDLTPEDITLILDEVEGLANSMGWLVDLFLYRIEGGATQTLPSEGVEDIELVQDDSIRNLLAGMMSLETN